MKMKNKGVLILLAGGLVFLLQSFLLNRKASPEFPEEVQQVLASACYDCHSSAGQNEDAKKALNFETWDDYRLTKQITLLGDIAEVIEKDKMPPGKYLEFKPDRKLSESQKELILNWAEETSESLMEGN
jgi:tRNA A37 N6-isopentenylltransferase MiaA